MKIFFNNYQDTIAQQQVDTSSTVTANELQNAQDSINPEPKTDSAVTVSTVNKVQSQKKDTLLKKIVPQKKHSIEKEVSNIAKEKQESEVSENFLKTIETNNSVIKPEGVFKNQGRQEFSTIKDDLGIERSLITNDWLMPVFFLSIGIMIWVRRTYYHHMELLFNSINNYHMSLKLFNDPSTRFRNLSYILNANAALTVGLFLHQLANYYNETLIQGGQFLNYAFIVSILLVIYVFQFVGYSILGNFTQGQKDYYEFLHHTYALNKVLGIIFIPIVLINAYSTEIVLPFFLILGTIIILIFYLKRIHRGILILMKKQFLKFHQILYFCTLEILPIMVISKFINDLIERSF